MNILCDQFPKIPQCITKFDETS